MANSSSHHHPSASNSLSDNCSGANKSSQQYCLKWSNYSTNLVRTFGQMILDENFVDVTLACEGQAIKAHKVVLSACSNYFKELFLANPCKHPIVILKDMKMEDLKTILDFMYKGEVNIFNHQLGALLKTADILKVKGLTESKDDEYDECHNQENTPPNNNTSNVNNNPISDLDKSGNLPYGGDRLLSVDRHPEPSVNHIHSSAQSIYQAQLPPTSNQQIFHQPQTFHAPSSTPQSLSTPLSHDSNNQLKLSSSQESFKNSQQLQKPCSINRKKRRRRSKRVNDGLSMDRGGESDSGSMVSGDEETAIKKESKGREDVISTPSCTATSSALDTNSNSNTVQSNNNSQPQEPNHSLSTGRKKLSLSTISQNVQSSNQDVLENSNFSHVDDSSEPWHDEGQIQLNEPIEEDDESNGVLNIKPLVSFDEGSGGESINNSISIPQDNLPVSQVQYKSHSTGNNESPSQVYKYSGQKCVCSVCHQSFTAYSSLRRHQEKHYPERRRYDCDICYKSYSRKDYLKEHRKHKHQM